MAWGGVQEAVALLCLVDLFPDAKLKETGCLLLETIVENIESVYGVALDDLPLIGASPDGTLVWKNGEINIVEVKCTCPYTDNPNKGGGWRNKGSKSNYGRYSVVDKPHMERIPPYHTPQLQMEILCSGPYCKFLARNTLSNSNNVFKSRYFLTFYHDQCAFCAVPPRTFLL